MAPTDLAYTDIHIWNNKSIISLSAALAEGDIAKRITTMEKITVVKVGGAVVEDEAQLMQLLKDFAAIEGNKVLVHGGGRSATKIAAQIGRASCRERV